MTAPGRTILILSPFDMITRNILATDMATHLARQPGLRSVLVTRNLKDAEAVAAHGPALAQEPMIRFLRSPAGWRERAAEALLAGGFGLHLVLTHRFNAVQGFKGHQDRLAQSWALRKPAVREGLPVLRFLDKPFPRSRRLLNALLALYWKDWQRHPRAASLFDREQPDLVVLAHCQNHFVTPYVLEALRRGVPILGVNGSWDQPTTKGPLAPGIQRFLVQSRQVAIDLERHHGVEPERCVAVGWPQMDLYARPGTLVDRDVFLARMGLPQGRRYILVGAYSERLGPHEPAMCRWLAEQNAQGAFGPDVTLWIRCHPNETQAAERFGALDRRPDVVVERPGMGDLPQLANLVRHAACVVSSAGTIGLDASALDTPSIAVAFEDPAVPFHDRPSRRYDMEHYAAVMATGGIRKVTSLEDLGAALAAYLQDRSLDAEGRARLRAEHLEPLDGRAAERTVSEIMRALQEWASEARSDPRGSLSKTAVEAG